MKYYVDPPSGWKFGFPKVWDDKTDVGIYDWLVENGYPQKIIDEFNDDLPYRMWEKYDE